MADILVIIAVVFYIAAGGVGIFTSSDKWRNVGLTWLLLAIGIVFFSIGLFLNVQS